MPLYVCLLIVNIEALYGLGHFFLHLVNICVLPYLIECLAESRHLTNISWSVAWLPWEIFQASSHFSMSSKFYTNVNNCGGLAGASNLTGQMSVTDCYSVLWFHCHVMSLKLLTFQIIPLASLGLALIFLVTMKSKFWAIRWQRPFF